MGKFALPGVRHLLAAGRELVAPSIFGAVKSAARRELPLGLGRKNSYVVLGVEVDVDYRDADAEPVILVLGGPSVLSLAAEMNWTASA
jgi:hypothetical protein